MRFGKTIATVAWSAFHTASALGNVVGVDTQNFNPTTSGLDFVTVHSSETLAPGVFNLGLFMNYAINTLPFFDREDGTTQSRVKFSDRLLSADFNFGLGLLPGWDVGLNLPYLIHQKGASEGFRGQFAETGLTEIRLNTKLQFVGDASQGLAAVASFNLNQIRDNPYTGKGAGPTMNLELVGDTTFGLFAVAANLGYRWRKPGEAMAFESEDPDAPDFPIKPLANQIIWSTAGSMMIPKTDTKLIAEIFGSRPVRSSDDNSNRLLSSAEMLLGVKHSLARNLDLHGGFGSELQHGISSPDWRIYAGVNWNTGTEKRPPSVRIADKPVEREPFSWPPPKEERITIHDILFEFDSDNLVLKGSSDVLDKLANYLLKPGFKRLIIEGHTDSVGTEEYNQNLSQRRAATIKRWLVSRHRIDTNKLTVLGKGESDPIADNGNYQGRQLNRRVVFHIFR